jgi:hypothetical protein
MTIRQISGSHGSDYENDCLLGRCAVQAVCISETLINLQQNKRRNTPEESALMEIRSAVKLLQTDGLTDGHMSTLTEAHI